MIIMVVEATKSDIAKIAVIGVIILMAIIVGSSALMCTGSCPVFQQSHFDRLVDVFIFLLFGGIMYIGIKATNPGNRTE